MIDLSGFFLSWPGRYLTQSFLHSLVAGAIAEVAVKAWGIARPSVRQRFLLAAIMVPAFTWPVFRIAGRSRESLAFRLDALFDSGRWLAVVLPGGITFGTLLLAAFAVTSVVFAAQELIPVLRHSFGRADDAPAALREGDDLRVMEALSGLPAGVARVHVIEDEDLFIFSSTGRDPAVYLSSGLLDTLSPAELRAALAHELAHVLRGRRPLMSGVFFLRVLMFFNPVILVEFRRAVQEDEKICDEMAVAFTGDPGALTETLRKLYLEDDEDPREKRSLAEIGGALERYSHRLNILSRIARLERGYPPPAGEDWFAFASALAAIGAVCWFVV